MRHFLNLPKLLTPTSWTDFFSLGGAAMLRAPRRTPQALRERNTLRQNQSGLLDTRRDYSFYSHSSGAPITSVGQKGIRCAEPFRRQSKAGAAPATVSGESFSHMPLDPAMRGLGRRRRVKTREPGDLPERHHRSGLWGARWGRTSTMVSN